MITHSNVINETPEEYHLLLRNRGEDELFQYIHSNHIARAEPYIYAGYEYEIHSFPEQIIASGKLRQLVYYVRGRKIGDEDGGSRSEIGCVIRFFRREDKKTDVVAELHHPAFEREFRSIFGIDEQEQGSQQLQEQIITDLQVRTINKSGDWLTKTYTLDERIGITALWHRWKTERGAIWTRLRHAQHFHIPQGVLSNWVTEYTL